MRRSDIPVRLRIARAADCAKIPDAALAKMAPADVAPRLLAADEYRRRAAVPHLDADLYRYRLGVAREVLETADPARAAELVKAADVLSYALRDGTKVPTSDADELKTAIGVGKRDHSTGGPGDDPAFRRHLIDRAKALNLRSEIPASWGPEYAGKSAKSTRAGALRKAAPRQAAEQQATIDHLARVATTAVERAASGLGLEIAEVRLGLRGVHGTMASATREVLTKAVHYEQQAARVTSPADRSTYLELARQEREKAGMA